MGNEFPGREIHARVGWTADLDRYPNGRRRYSPDARGLEVLAQLVG